MANKLLKEKNWRILLNIFFFKKAFGCNLDFNWMRSDDKPKVFKMSRQKF